MKWIGQHIWDFISRFRNDVYFEAVPDGTIASGKNLGLDSDNKLVKESDTGITDLHGAGVNGAANQLLTDDGDGTVTSEASFTFDGDTATISSATTQKPEFVLKSTTNDNKGSNFKFVSDKGGAGADSDFIGAITFIGDNSAQEQYDFCRIDGKVGTALDTDEAGRLLLRVAASNGSLSSLKTGLELIGHGTDNEVDLNIGYGSTSSTTVAGTLTMGSTLFANNSGVVQVATQGTIDHDSLANFVAAEHYRWDTDISATATINAANIPTLNQNTTGNAATATTLATARAINGVDFDGSAPITITAAGSTLSDTVTVAKGGTGATTLTSNALLTGSGTSAIQAESDLTFSSGQLTLSDNNTNKPIIQIKSTGGTAHIGGSLDFITDEGNAGASGDVLGRVRFIGDNADQDVPQQTYAQIQGKVDVATDGEESGILELQVANHDDDLGTGLTLTGGSANDEIDVTVGLGSSSLTTISGDLQVSGNDITNNASATNFNISSSRILELQHAGSYDIQLGNSTNADVLKVQGNSEVVTVNGDLIVNGDSVTFESANSDDPIFTLKNTNNGTNDPAQMIFIKDRGAAPAVGTNLGEVRFQGEDSNQNSQEYGGFLCEIDVATDGQESGQFGIWVATHDGELQYGLQLTGGDAEDKVNVAIGQGAASLTTIAGDLQVNGNILPGITYVKILPSDFMPDDGGRPAMIDDTGSDRWLESHGTLKLFAYVDIPAGFKATHVDVYGSATSAVTVYEADVDSKTVTSKGTGNIGTQINITDVNSDATNYILIELAQASGEEVYGGKLTIAEI